MNLRSDQLSEVDEHLSAMSGKSLSAFRKSYGRMAHAHIGQLQPRINAPDEAVHKDQGEFVIDLLDCDRAVILAEGANLASTADGDESVLEAMSSLVGQVVSTVSIEPESLTLRIRFANGSILTLIGDMNVSADSEQWAITFPGHMTLVAEGTRILRLQS